MTTIAEYKKSKRDLKREYHRLFTSPQAEKVLADLNEKFNGTTLKKVDGVIDPNASIAAAGCREVLLYIDQMSTE